MSIQKTYAAIKPDAYSFRQDIIERIKNAGYRILLQKEVMFTREDAEMFYEEHKGKVFFPGLIEFMTSGPIYAMVLEKEGCIADFRSFIGKTDPKKAASNTIRSDYGTELPKNAIHASDSKKAAEREIKLVFG